MTAIPGYSTEKFQNISYISDVAQKWTYNKVSLELIFSFFPIFSIRNNFTELFFNGFQKVLSPNAGKYGPE